MLVTMPAQELKRDDSLVSWWDLEVQGLGLAEMWFGFVEVVLHYQSITRFTWWQNQRLKVTSEPQYTYSIQALLRLAPVPHNGRLAML